MRYKARNNDAGCCAVVFALIVLMGLVRGVSRLIVECFN